MHVFIELEGRGQAHSFPAVDAISQPLSETFSLCRAAVVNPVSIRRFDRDVVQAASLHVAAEIIFLCSLSNYNLLSDTAGQSEERSIYDQTASGADCNL